MRKICAFVSHKCMFIFRLDNSTEVLSASGLLEEMPPFVDDHVQTVASAKDRVLAEANKFRKGVRKSLRKERMAALGFASGAFVGILL